MTQTPSWLEPVVATYEQFTAALVGYLPTLISALLVIVFGLFAAWLLKRLVRRVSVAAASLTRRFTGERAVALGRLPWPLSTIIATLVYWLTIVFFLAVTARILGLPGIAAWIQAAAGVVPRILAAAVIVLIGYSLAVMVREAITRLGTDDQTRGHRAIAQTLFLLINLIAIIVGTDQLGVDLSLLQSIIVILIAAIVGGMAFAFGMGAGNSIDNVIAGYYVRKTYRRGQRVRIGGMDGEILDLTPTAVLIDSPAGRAMVPAKLFQQEVSILLDEGEMQV
jgi:hypothetical protein